METTPSKMRISRAPEDLDNKIAALGESKGKNYDTLIELPNAETSGEDPNRYEWLKNARDTLAHLNDGFHCCLKALQRQRLNDSSNEDVYKVCQALTEVIYKAKQTDRLLNSGYTIKIYYRMNSLGRVNENITVCCPKSGLERPISAFEKQDMGRRCEYFRLTKADARLAKTSPKR